jgi:hypothetical protein
MHADMPEWLAKAGVIAILKGKYLAAHAGRQGQAQQSDTGPLHKVTHG